MAFFPGGPSPDSALPSHSKPIDPTRHQTAAFTIDQETHHLQGDGEMASQQNQEELAPQPIIREHPSDLPPQLSNVRVVVPNSEVATEGSPSLGKEERRSTSVASRHSDRSLPAGDVGESASAAGAVAVANGPPDVDPNLQARATNVEEELRPKATIGKERGVSRKISKIEKHGAKVERATLQIAVQELEEARKRQEIAMKEEIMALSVHSHAVDAGHKSDMDLLAASTAHDQAQANLRAAEMVLEATRKHRRETTEVVQKKLEEVDHLRGQTNKKVDDEGRAIKSPIRRGLGRILGSG